MVLAPNQKPNRKEKQMTNDCREICEGLVKDAAESCSVRRLAGSTGWSVGRVAAALDEAEKAGAVRSIGSLGMHFSVDPNKLSEILTAPAPAAEPTPEPAPATAPAAEPAPAPAVAEAPAPAPEPAPAPVPEAEPAPEPAPKKSRLSFLMAKIHAVKAPEILTGDAREARLAELFEQCVNIVVEINEAIAEIASKFPMYVDSEKDLVQIVRITPEPGSTAPGGIKLSYFPKDRKGFRKERFLLEEPWPTTLTAGGGGYIVKRVEREAVALVERMTNFVLRQK